MTPSPKTRSETDSFGPIEVPGHDRWSAQTECSLRFFAIGEQRMPLDIVHALAQVERDAAELNGGLDVMALHRAAAIAEAAARIAAGKFDGQFPLSMWQTGSGSQSNMNLTEVVAHLASRVFSEVTGANARVHPNDDVSLGQLSNGSYDAQLALVEAALRRTLPDVHRPMNGGTAGGTGLNGHLTVLMQPLAMQPAPTPGASAPKATAAVAEASCGCAAGRCRPGLGKRG